MTLHELVAIRYYLSKVVVRGQEEEQLVTLMSRLNEAISQKQRSNAA